MKLLTIKDGAGSAVQHKARIMLGTPPEMGTLYVLLADDGSDDGKSHAKSLKITHGKTVEFVIFDCVEVANSIAYGYSHLTRQRSKVIGEFVSFA